MRIRTFVIVLVALMLVVAVGTRTGLIPSVRQMAAIARGEAPPEGGGFFSGPLPVKSAGLSADEMNNVEIYKMARQATVHISTTIYQQNFFFEVIPAKETGTGFIIREDGLILTNQHVIAGNEPPEVTLSDTKKKYIAEIVARDRKNDLALIKIKTDRKLATLKLGDSDPILVGQKVLAIGNPFEFDFTLTTGIVSSVGRSIRADENKILEGMIQTDAAINPGNSGGPLLDSQGTVIGVNTAIYGPQGSIGLGFAMPINRAKSLIDDYAAGRPTGPAWVGVSAIPVAGDFAKALDLPEEGGLLVQQVIPGSPADKAGVRPPKQNLQISRYIIGVGGDLIMAIDGRKAESQDAISRSVDRKRPGDSLTLEVYRGGRRQTLRLQLAMRPDDN